MSDKYFGLVCCQHSGSPAVKVFEMNLFDSYSDVCQKYGFKSEVLIVLKASSVEEVLQKVWFC